jgi:ribonuclease HII
MQQLRIHIDEAGRGPLAGPVFVGCTMSLQNFTKTDFQDSKALSPRKREQIYQTIFDHEQQGHIIAASGRATNHNIDTKGIIPSLQKACHRGLFVLLKKYFVMRRQQALLESVHGEDHIAARQLRQIFATAR